MKASDIINRLALDNIHSEADANIFSPIISQLKAYSAEYKVRILYVSGRLFCEGCGNINSCVGVDLCEKRKQFITNLNAKL